MFAFTGEHPAFLLSGGPMATETVEPVETTEPVETEPSFDMASAVEKVSASLQSSLFKEDIPVKEDGPVSTATVTPVPATPEQSPTAAVVPSIPDVPKSWTKEMQPHWTKLPPEVQAYWQTREQQMAEGSEKYRQTAEQFRALQEVITPFEGLIRQQGLTPPQALNFLLNAHQRLSIGTPEQRQAAYEQIGKDLGLTLPQAGTNGTPATAPDPAVLSLQQQLQQIQSTLTARQQQEFQAASEKAKKEVETFAADPAHPHFDEVADDIVLLLKTGLPLQDAYDKAVWANPLTREKNLQARLLTEHAKAAENARLDALPKAKAAKAHVRGVETRHTPKEPIGKMEDTLKDTLREIRQRAH
jgi:hypothetical protein